MTPLTNLHQRSIDIIRAGQAKNGAYAACASFSQYGYSWLRDGTWIAYGMDQAGQSDSAADFHRWAARTLLRYRDQVDNLLTKLERKETPQESDYLPTRFQLDGSLGEENWTDFQLDGYGAWLWGLCQHCTLHNNTDLWAEAHPAVEIVVRYLAALWQSPNYDCWEEHRQEIHTATLAALYGGLKAVQEMDASLVPDNLPETIRTFILDNCVSSGGHFMKFIGNDAVDASLLWTALPYGLVSLHDSRFQATLAKIEQDIRHPGGGVYRYAADTYYGGGEWLLLTVWLAWVYFELGRIDDARRLFAWIQAQAKLNGDMPEQVSGHLLDAIYYPGWVERWGDPASPLLWSHGMYLILEARLKAG
jgi:GH15 family glucan-1,4-alpha-glucosidase